MRLQHPRTVLSLLLALVAASLTMTGVGSAATKPVPGLGASCERPTTTPGTAVTCTVLISAVPGGPEPTGTFSLSVPSYKGTVSPDVCVISEGQCTLSYTPKGSGSSTRKDTITATYSGDSFYATAKVLVVVGVRLTPMANFSFFCFPAETTPGVSVPCLIVLSDSGEGAGEPSGTVTVSVPSYKGSVSPTSCSFSAGGSCNLSYTPVGTGSSTRKDVITATYSGNTLYGTGKATTTVFVGPKPTPTLNFSCGEVTTPGVATSCTMTMSGSLGPVDGNVTFTVPSYKGTIVPSSCWPGAPCSPTYTPKGTGSASRKDTITATYSGDARYAATKTTFVVAVHAS